MLDEQPDLEPEMVHRRRDAALALVKTLAPGPWALQAARRGLDVSSVVEPVGCCCHGELG